MMKPVSDNEYMLSRRQALIGLAALPITYVMEHQKQWKISQVEEEFLPCCAAGITACWHLLRGSDFSIVDEILSKYLPLLVSLTLQVTPYQATVAALATQGYRIKGILALHRNDRPIREDAFQQAVFYGDLSQQLNLQAAALISLAYHQSDPVQSGTFFARALALGERHTPLLLSRLYASMAVVSAQQKRKQEALHYLALSQDCYPSDPKADPSFLYADFSPASRIMEHGRTYLALHEHYPHENYADLAQTAFDGIAEIQSQNAVPERIRVEILNYQTQTALARRDFEAFSAFLEQGVQAAFRLGSEKRRQEAMQILQNAFVIWPQETQIKQLTGLFIPAVL